MVDYMIKTKEDVAINNVHKIYTADYLYINHKMVSDHAILVDNDGIIVEIAPIKTILDHYHNVSIINFKNKAIFPGFVNTHSHAFQRLIRGKTSYASPGKKSNFWSWREQMYLAALSLDEDDLEVVTSYTYLEMLLAGITSVAEFHYIHNDKAGRFYNNITTLSERVLLAAKKIGLSLTLIPVAYNQGGFFKAPEDLQRRFILPSVDIYFEFINRVSNYIEKNNLTSNIGISAHSIRAVPLNWLAPLAEFAEKNKFPLHIHVAEQESEVIECISTYGITPMELLERSNFLTSKTTLVHATHLVDKEKDIIAKSGSIISICPTTERDLGDGIIDLKGLFARNVPFSLGSDSQVQINFFEEMRALEGHARLKEKERNILLSKIQNSDFDNNNLHSIVPTLWSIATNSASQSVCRDVGKIEKGYSADFFTLDLNYMPFDGCSKEDIPSVCITSGEPSFVKDVVVKGKMVISNRYHDSMEKIRDSYNRINSKLRL